MMKKLLVLICALFALVACNLELAEVVETPDVNKNDEIKLNITITRTDIFPDTKATVKSGWADGDVVFLFFKGVASPKYMEMKYDANTRTWTEAQKNGLAASDLSGATDKNLTAVYLPYGSDFTVSDPDNNGSFVFSETYCGHFYVDQEDYSFDGTTLIASIKLEAAAPAEGKLVHFDVAGYTAGHTYALYQDNMKPLTLTSIASDGTVNKNVGSTGDAILGYIDAGNSIVSFSGVLDATAVGSPVNYWFSIRDTEDGTLHYRDAGNKTISKNMYIGLGNIASNWTIATPGAFSVDASGDKVTIARSNLSYRGTLTEKKWQLMKYPWSMIEPRSSTTNPRFYTKSTVDFGLFAWGTSGWNNTKADPTWENYQPWSVRNTEAYKPSNPKYTNNTYAFGPAYDSSSPSLTGANANGDWGVYNTIYSYGGGTLSGSWRTPTNAEWAYIIGREKTYVYAKAVVAGVPGLVIFPDSFSKPSDIDVISANTSNASPFAINTYPEYQWNKIEAAGAVFLPATGVKGFQYISDKTDYIQYVNHVGVYWSTTVIDATKAYDLYFSDGTKEAEETAFNIVAPGDDCHRYAGCAVRLVRDVSNGNITASYDGTWTNTNINE